MLHIMFNGILKYEEVVQVVLKSYSLSLKIIDYHRFSPQKGNHSGSRALAVMGLRQNFSKYSLLYFREQEWFLVLSLTIFVTQNR